MRQRAMVAAMGAALLVWVVAACAGPTSSVPAVTSVTIDQQDRALEVGASVALSATVSATGGAGEGVEWSSGDSGVASVASDGTVTAASGGVVQITATSEFDPTKSDSITVTVPEAMNLVFDTTLSTGTTVALELYGTVDVTVDWGDGSSDTVIVTGGVPHTYASEGVYQVEITGALTEFGSQSPSSVSQAKLTSVESWGDLGLTSINGAFVNAVNLTSVPEAIPPSVTDIGTAFAFATSFHGDLSTWDVSNVTNFAGMFFGHTSFDQDLSSWDMSSAQGLSGMFGGATAFNGDITNWDVSNVADMGVMFSNASAFNRDISGWDVSNVAVMEGMFANTNAFDQDISGWNVSNVVDMDAMFEQAIAFNQDLSGWCVSNIPSEPTGFDTGATSWVLPRPVWGTCP